MSSAPDGSVLFASSFRYPDRRFLWSSMKLFANRLELSGWDWRGRHHCVVALRDVTGVRWWTGEGPANLGLQLDGGTRVELRVERAGLWKHKIQARAPRAGSPLTRSSSKNGSDNGGEQARGEDARPALQQQQRELQRQAPERLQPLPSAPPSTRKSGGAKSGGAAQRGDGAGAREQQEALIRSHAATARRAAASAAAPPAWRVEDAVLLALCGVLCGAEDLETLRTYTRAKATRMRRLLHMPVLASPGREPGEEAAALLQALLERVRPAALRQHLACWRQRLAVRLQAGGDGAPPAGPALPGAGDRLPLDGVAAAAGAEGALLLQAASRSAAARDAPALPATLDVDGCAVAALLVPPAAAGAAATGGAPGRLPRYARPHRLARALQESGAHALVALSAGDPLAREVETLLLPSSGNAASEAAPARSGRALPQPAAGRCCWAADVRGSTLQHAGAWPQLATAAVVEHAPEKHAPEKHDTEKHSAGEHSAKEHDAKEHDAAERAFRRRRRCYVGHTGADAVSILRQTRGFPPPPGRAPHAAAQDLGWALSVAAPASRSGSGARAGENLASLRSVAAALLASSPTTRGSLEQKRQRAGWDDDYLRAVLGQQSSTASPETAETATPPIRL